MAGMGSTAGWGTLCQSMGASRSSTSGLLQTAKHWDRAVKPAKLTNIAHTSSSVSQPTSTVWDSGGTAISSSSSSSSSWQGKKFHQMALQAKPFIAPHPSPDNPPDSRERNMIRIEADTLIEERKSANIGQEEERRIERESQNYKEDKEDEDSRRRKCQEDQEDSQGVDKPYLLMPGPEASRTALSASCLEVTAKEEDFSGSSSSSSGAADHHHLIGKHPGGSGGKGARFHLNSNYSLHELACQAASTGAALNCAAGVPPVVGKRVARGEKTTARPIRAGLDSTAVGLSDDITGSNSRGNNGQLGEYCLK